MIFKKPFMPYSLRVGEQRFVAGARGISSRRKTRKPFVQPPAAAVVNVTGVSGTGEKRERDVAPHAVPDRLERFALFPQPALQGTRMQAERRGDALVRAISLNEEAGDYALNFCTQRHGRTGEAMLDKAGSHLIELWIAVRQRQIEVFFIEKQAIHALSKSQSGVEVGSVGRQGGERLVSKPNLARAGLTSTVGQGLVLDERQRVFHSLSLLSLCATSPW